LRRITALAIVVVCVTRLENEKAHIDEEDAGDLQLDMMYRR
jgi:hypothetical protein